MKNIDWALTKPWDSRPFIVYEGNMFFSTSLPAVRVLDGRLPEGQNRWLAQIPFQVDDRKGSL